MLRVHTREKTVLNAKKRHKKFVYDSYSITRQLQMHQSGDGAQLLASSGYFCVIT